MLIDLDIDYAGKFQRLDTGMYLLLSILADYELLKNTGQWMEFSFQYPEFQGSTGQKLAHLRQLFDKDEWYSEFGSCDNPEQFKTYTTYQILCNSPYPFVVVFKHLPKAENAGYRWHKNGPYLGVKMPGYEYLGDEPDIEEIYQYHIYRKKT